MAGVQANLCKNPVCGNRTFHASGYCKAHRPDFTYQLVATVKKTKITQFHTPDSLGETLNEALTAGGLNVISLSVHEDLPLLTRLQTIEKLLDSFDDTQNSDYVDQAMIELEKLIKRVNPEVK